MEAAGNRKGSRNSCHEEEDRGRAPAYGAQNTGGNPSDRRPLNPGHNAQLRYNPGHDKGRAYSGYGRGWQWQ
jgi:hypothetical protein